MACDDNGTHFKQEPTVRQQLIHKVVVVYLRWLALVSFEAIFCSHQRFRS